MAGYQGIYLLEGKGPFRGDVGRQLPAFVGGNSPPHTKLFFSSQPLTVGPNWTLVTDHPTYAVVQVVN